VVVVVVLPVVAVAVTVVVVVAVVVAVLLLVVVVVVMVVVVVVMVVNDAVQQLRLYGVEQKDKLMMNCEGCRRKRSWPNFQHYPGIFLEGLKKATRILGQDSRSPSLDLNPGPP
jgi:hypothetical protein